MTVNGKKIFGQGNFIGVNNVTNPTPTRFGLVQDQTVTFKRDTASLFGEDQFAADVSSGKLEVTGKVTYGESSIRVFSDLLFGTDGVDGQTLAAFNEEHTASGSTITVTHGGTFQMDMGVVDVATGLQMVCVASGPVAGESYTVDPETGEYTFAAGDATIKARISYLYTSSSSGQTVSITNKPMGRVGGFTAVMVFPWTNPSNVVEQDILTLNNCIGSDSEIATKLGDYAKPTFGFTAATDTNNILGSFSFAEANAA